MQSHKLGDAMFDVDDIFCPPSFDVQICHNDCMPPICDDYNDESGFGEVMTLFSDESTILDEASIDYKNKIANYNNYGNDIYNIKNNNNHETYHHDFNFQSHDSYFVEFAPTTIHQTKFAHVESNKFSMLVDHKKNVLCDGYIVEFIHDDTENYYERGTYSCRNCNNIKFPLYVLKVSKLCLFCLPMLVDYCSHKWFAHKIPMHRKWVRLKCASHMLHDAPVIFQFLSFM